jgi:hypothetical protein
MKSFKRKRVNSKAESFQCGLNGLFFNTVKKTINTCKYKRLSDVIAKEYSEIVNKRNKQRERIHSSEQVGIYTP